MDIREITRTSSYFAYAENSKKEQISHYIGDKFTEKEIDSGVSYIIGTTCKVIRGSYYPPSATAVQMAIPKLKQYIFETPLEEIDPKIFPAISYTTKPYRELKGFLSKDTKIVGKAMNGDYRAKIVPERLPEFMDIMAELAPEIIDACFEKLSLDIKEFNENQRKAAEAEAKYQAGRRVQFAKEVQVAQIVDMDEGQGVNDAGTIATEGREGNRAQWVERIRKRKSEEETVDASIRGAKLPKR